MTTPTHIQRRGFRVARVAFILILAMPALQANPRPDALLHKPAPPFVRDDLDNHRVDLAAFKGHVVLLNFWATWCAPCQVELPRFIAWQSQYGVDGLQVIGVSMDDDSAPVGSFARQHKIDYPVVMGDRKLGLQYGGVLGLPTTYLIDRKGIVRARFKGETHLDAMKATMRKLLREQ